MASGAGGCIDRCAIPAEHVAIAAQSARHVFPAEVGGSRRAEGTQWMVPQTVLSTARLELVPEPVTGRAIVEYEWTGIALSKFAIPPMPPIRGGRLAWAVN